MTIEKENRNIPAVSNDHFLYPNDMTLRCEAALDESCYIMDRPSPVGWFRQNFINDLSPDERTSGVIRAPNSAGHHDHNISASNSGEGGIFSSGHYLTADPGRIHELTDRVRYHGQEDLADSYIRCDYYDQNNGEVGIRTSDGVQYEDNLVDSHANNGYYQESSATNYWNNGSGVSAYGGYSTMDGSQPVIIGPTLTEGTEEPLQHLDQLHYNRQTFTMGSSGGFLVKLSNPDCSETFVTSTSAASYSNAPSGMASSSVVTPVTSLSPQTRSEITFDRNNNDRCFTSLQTVCPSDISPINDPTGFHSTNSVIPIHYSPDLQKDQKGTKTISDNSWHHYSQHQLRSSVIRSNYQSGAMCDQVSGYYGSDHVSGYLGGAFDSIENGYNRQLQSSHLMAQNFDITYNNPTVRLQNALKKEETPTMKPNSVPTENVKALGLTSGVNSSINGINSRPIRKRPLRSLIDTSKEVITKPQVPLEKKTTESGRRPRMQRGGWQREQPPKFMTDDEKKQWEKDRRKKDNHNQIERRRRYNINDRIRQLSGLLPSDRRTISSAHSKDSLFNKGTILKASIEYIEMLQAQEKRLRLVEEQRLQLRATNEEMKLKLRKLEQLLKRNGVYSTDMDYHDTVEFKQQEVLLNNIYRLPQNNEVEFGNCDADIDHARLKVVCSNNISRNELKPDISDVAGCSNTGSFVLGNHALCR